MGTKTQIEAKKNKNDEFYTRYEDVNNELSKYMEQFNGKTIYCPCDECQFDPLDKTDGDTTSFIKFFIKRRDSRIMKIKKLIATAYNEDGAPAAYYTWTPDMDKMEEHKFISSNGDFRSAECIELLKEADIVVTNPPFSLFREFIKLIMQYEKKFLILGNINAITYKEFFPLIKENKVWAGYGFNMSMIYKTPYKNELEGNQDYVRKHGLNPEEGYVKVPAVCWFTNLDTIIRHQFFYTNALYNSLSSKLEDYSKYDNYEAINVDKVLHIPMDYEGVMGVPITFLDRYCPEQFEILGIMSGVKAPNFMNGNDGNLKFTVNGKSVYARILIRKISKTT